MANEYKQGVDRVAVDESFPYPIKLTYDDEHIYLTPMWIPRQIHTSTVQNGTLYLCLEIGTTERVHKHRNKNGSRNYSGFNTKKHPCRHGKFIVPGYDNYYDSNARETFTAQMTELSLNHTYSFPINIALTSIVTNKLKHANEGYYIKVRGSYRRLDGATLDSLVSYITFPSHSNTAKIDLTT